METPSAAGVLRGSGLAARAGREQARAKRERSGRVMGAGDSWVVAEEGAEGGGEVGGEGWVVFGERGVGDGGDAETAGDDFGFGVVGEEEVGDEFGVSGGDGHGAVGPFEGEGVAGDAGFAGFPCGPEVFGGWVRVEDEDGAAHGIG